MTLKVLLWSLKGSGTDHYGGPGMSAYRLYQTAEPGRFEVSLVHGFSSQPTYSLFKEQHYLGDAGKNPISQLKFTYSGNRWISSYANRFDVFHGVQGFHSTIQPALQAERLGLPCVVKLAAYKSDLASKSGWKSWLRLPERRREMVKKHVSGLIAISQDIVLELREYGIPESKIVYIPNGVNTDQFHPIYNQTEKDKLRRQLGWLELPTIIFVGTVNRRKRPHLIVEALSKVKAKGFDCQLVLVGPQREQNYASEIKTLVKKLGLNSRVVWFGFTKDVAPLYQAADMFGLLSSNEGLPNALIEAMSSGLASIVTPISGTIDLITDGINGRLCSPDADEVADALLTYLKCPDLIQIHGQAAREKVLKQFSHSAVLDAHERLFKRVISGRDAAG